jgi:topoisomerase-4 subunit A
MEENNGNDINQNDSQERVVKGMYEDWFLDYASYVILERAVPSIVDGLKPVQRRILHSMKEMDDGRYHKVANIIGNTMQYHPHGDAAIGDAMVNIGQKELLIDTQGNWGDFRTGDRAAAPRYIEARLTKFALEVGFNKQTTVWQKSYDGRNNEPVDLPVKFPLLLAQGVEGIAVGLSTKIMPHNFIELIKASIGILNGKKANIKPDFPTGGLADFSDYNEGRRGGRIRVRAKLVEKDKKTLLIKEIPYGQTTGSIIDSIIKANDKGKIKIKQVVDNTAKELEIEVHLAAGVSVDKTIDALYAFTNCEVSISPNACVIVDKKPRFMSVNEILEYNTGQTKSLLGQELEIKRGELQEKWHFSSLEKIFIEERIYRDIEEAETWEEIIQRIDKGLDPFKKQLKREVTEEDIVRLTEIKIKRISKYDSFKADELLKSIEDDLAQVNHDIEHLNDFTISFYEGLLKKYGAGKERRTEERSFGTIERTIVAARTEKLYVNRSEGFAGTGLKKDEFISNCSDIDDIIVFTKDGNYSVSKVSNKAFFGKDIIHIEVWRKGDERMVYNCIYTDKPSGKTFIKRFSVKAITRDKVYNVGNNEKDTKVLYFTANPNAEAETITVYLHGMAKARKKIFDFDFSELLIKGRGAKGNTLSKYRIRKIEFKQAGKSTIGGRDIWYEPAIGRLNVDGRGNLLGSFETDDSILVLTNKGEYELTNHEITNHYDPKQVYSIEQYHPERVISAIHFDAKQKTYFVKRFQIETTSLDKRFQFINEGRNSTLVFGTTHNNPTVEITYRSESTPKGEKETEELNLKDFIDIKGWKSTGNKLPYDKIYKVKLTGKTPDDFTPEQSGGNSETPEDKSSTEETVKEAKSAPIPPEEKKEESKGKTFTSGDQLNLL